MPSVYRTDFGGLITTNAGADIVMNMTSGKLENLSFTDGFRMVEPIQRTLQASKGQRSETLSGKVRRSAETSMNLTPNRAEEICRAAYNEVKKKIGEQQR